MKRSSGPPVPRPRSRPEFDEWEDWYRRRDYREMPWYSARPSPWLVRVVRQQRFRPRTSILDVGCGTGSNVLWLARRGYSASGVDVAPTAIATARDRARRAGVDVDLRVASADALPFGRERFDGAVDNGCFHSLPIRQRAPYVRELVRVLRPGAPLLLTWIPREVRTSLGPPHRPSLGEVVSAFEPGFVFSEMSWHPPDTPGAWKVLDARMGRSTALLHRRLGRQPPPR